MSWFNGAVPDDCRHCVTEVELVIVPRTVDIGGFEVHRALPFQKRRMVGPFIFWDQAGPGRFASGRGVDVRPHPHIGLSTVTYLFDGSLDHKDSLGNDLRIVPGDVNLMTAGRGIVHSERTGADVRRAPSSLFGIQSWLAQPAPLEMGDPDFTHRAAEELPTFATDELSGKVILGEFQGYRSPLDTGWETIYVEVKMKEGARLEVPKTPEERALHLVSGRLDVSGTTIETCRMAVLRPGSDIVVTAAENSHLLLLGGAAMDGPRYIWWNFVASSVDRIKSAAEDWKRGRFEVVPGDDQEFIPLPDLPFPSEP